MKYALFIGLFTAIGWSAHTQGLVYFANANLQSPPDRLVRHVDGLEPLVGTNWCAQLYYGANEASLNPVAALPRRFHDGTTRAPGTWIGDFRTLDGFSTGETATLQVRVWDCALFQDFDSAVAGGGIYGRSIPFTYIVPPADSPFQSFWMENFQGFTLIPEPATIALFMLGGALVFARLRRRE